MWITALSPRYDLRLRVRVRGDATVRTLYDRIREKIPSLRHVLTPAGAILYPGATTRTVKDIFRSAASVEILLSPDPASRAAPAAGATVRTPSPGGAASPASAAAPAAGAAVRTPSPKGAASPEPAAGAASTARPSRRTHCRPAPSAAFRPPDESSRECLCPPSFAFDSPAQGQLVGMGFSAEEARCALEASHGSLVGALRWLTGGK